MRNIKSIAKKVKTIISGGLDNIEAIKEGIRNYNNTDNEVEDLAKERVLTCLDCEYFTDEANVVLSIDDTLIPESDGMMCGDCGCALPYKLRQSKKKCKKWEK